MAHAITHTFPFRITSLAHPATHFTDRFANSPKFRIGRMAFKPAFVGGWKHFVVDPGRIPDAEYGYSPVYQFLTNPVDSSVALCTDKHLRFPVQCFVNCFDKSRCFSGSRRTVNDGYITCAEYLVDSCFLGAVQPGEADRIQLPESRFLWTKQNITQFC